MFYSQVQGINNLNMYEIGPNACKTKTIGFVTTSQKFHGLGKTQLNQTVYNFQKWSECHKNAKGGKILSALTWWLAYPFEDWSLPNRLLQDVKHQLSQKNIHLSWFMFSNSVLENQLQQKNYFWPSHCLFPVSTPILIIYFANQFYWIKNNFHTVQC
jgi:hypothetical protein